MTDDSPGQAHLALVHHANQFLITNGYDNREGIAGVLGSLESRNGLVWGLELHRRHRVPVNLHLSGTLIEAIAWHQPGFFRRVRELAEEGLVEFIGSAYGQNIMRFFGADYNRRQLDEELRLFRLHLGVDPVEVKTFWPPERVWETGKMARLLRDPDLLNGGYERVILDDRLLLSPHGDESPRARYDRTAERDPALFRMQEVEHGHGLCVLPIATHLRRAIPPHTPDDWEAMERDLRWLAMLEGDTLAVYGDDMEKAAGIGEWGSEGPARYEALLRWVNERPWVCPVRIADWAAGIAPAGRQHVEVGTFNELAKEFQAGEGYDGWFYAEDWRPYREAFAWADRRVREVETQGADAALLDLAHKQLMVGSWETAWHTPASGPHGDADEHGHASPWARALTSHSRHAAVIAEAAHWARHHEGRCEALRLDIDGDGEEEVVLRSPRLFAVVTPRWGGRLVALFHVGHGRGVMAVGNPCDDWNWMEDLNRYMDVPRNHPGAFADVKFEHDAYAVESLAADANGAEVRLRNTEESSAARGLLKSVRLQADQDHLTVRYHLPDALDTLATECGLSPDYLCLLRHGTESLERQDDGAREGWRCGDTWVWVDGDEHVEPRPPFQDRFGHGCAVRLMGHGPEFEIRLGVSRLQADPDGSREAEAVESAA